MVTCFWLAELHRVYLSFLRFSSLVLCLTSILQFTELHRPSHTLSSGSLRHASYFLETIISLHPIPGQSVSSAHSQPLAVCLFTRTLIWISNQTRVLLDKLPPYPNQNLAKKMAAPMAMMHIMVQSLSNFMREPTLHAVIQHYNQLTKHFFLMFMDPHLTILRC